MKPENGFDKQSHLCQRVEGFHLEVERDGGDQTSEEDDASDSTKALHLPPHHQAGDSPGDHGHGHEIDEERPNVAGAGVRGAAVEGVHPKKCATRNHAVLSGKAGDVDVTIPEDVSHAGGFAVDFCNEVELAPTLGLSGARGASICRRHDRRDGSAGDLVGVLTELGCLI